jgi:glycosyltransferase involved in cell wall biosynthesis
VRVWSYITPNNGFLKRVLAQLSFGCLAPVLGARAVGLPDIIIVESPPLFDTISGRFLGMLKRCPYILTIADIWPESAVQLGVLHNRLVILLAERLEWSSYQRSGAVWALTSGIRQTLIGRGLPADHVFLLPNGVDIAKFRPHDKRRARAQLGWDGRYTVLYAGTIGLAHGLTTVLDAAERLRQHPDVRIIFIGEGARRAELEAETSRRGASNITFLAPLPHSQMPLVISASDACLVSLRRVPLFDGARPSKMYEAMASARPILLAVDGEARHLVVEQARAAMYVEPENPAALADAILTLRDHPELADDLGQHGRAFAEAYFDRDMLTTQLEGQITAILGRARHRRSLAGVEQAAHSAP